MRIAYVGPEGRNHILRSWASPGVIVETRSANFSGAIESSYDEYLKVTYPYPTSRRVRAEAHPVGR